jgi:hypothetical protein
MAFLVPEEISKSDTRQLAGELIDRLPETQLSRLVRFLETTADPVAAALANAPLEAEGDQRRGREGRSRGPRVAPVTGKSAYRRSSGVHAMPSSGPTYSALGRINRLFAYCSSTCAV